MRFVPTRVHGMLDYLMGALLVASPWLFGFADGSAAQWVPVGLGAGAIAYSLLTDYELGAVRFVPMGLHLLLDFASGALLAASPFFSGFSHRVWIPHVVLGLLEMGASLVTRTDPAPGAAPLRRGRARNA